MQDILRFESAWYIRSKVLTYKLGPSLSPDSMYLNKPMIINVTPKDMIKVSTSSELDTV